MSLVIAPIAAWRSLLIAFAFQTSPGSRFAAVFPALVRYEPPPGNDIHAVDSGPRLLPLQTRAESPDRISAGRLQRLDAYLVWHLGRIRGNFRPRNSDPWRDRERLLTISRRCRAWLRNRRLGRRAVYDHQDRAWCLACPIEGAYPNGPGLGSRLPPPYRTPRGWPAGVGLSRSPGSPLGSFICLLSLLISVCEFR
jgi:hypothetical protein